MERDESVEFSRPIDVDRIGPGEVHREFQANPGEREALARRFGLASLDLFRVAIDLRRTLGGIIEANGRIEADLVQCCVVTLEPLPSHVAEEFQLRFVEGPSETRHELEIDPTGVDEPEPLEGKVLDLGELAAEQLGLAIDPYPRKPGAELPEGWPQPEEDRDGPKKPSAFEVLRNLRDKKR